MLEWFNTCKLLESTKGSTNDHHLLLLVALYLFFFGNNSHELGNDKEWDLLGDAHGRMRTAPKDEKKVAWFERLAYARHWTQYLSFELGLPLSPHNIPAMELLVTNAGAWALCLVIH